MSVSNKTLLQQFRSFYLQNNCTNFEKAVEYFTVFGGLGWKVDTQKPLLTLIKDKILKHYPHLHRQIVNNTQGDNLYHGILSGIALGDAQTHTALKRSRVEKEEGQADIQDLEDKGIITLKTPYPNIFKDDGTSNKAYFNSPFMRFWFAFVSPLFQGIKKGDYSEVNTAFENKREVFTQLVFRQLCQELLIAFNEDDPIVEIGSYWDKELSIDIVARTASGKMIASSCIYINSKIKNTQLTKLKSHTKALGLEIDRYVLFSKKGFSEDVKKQKGETLRLYTVKNLKKLVENLSVKDLIKGFKKI